MLSGVISNMFNFILMVNYRWFTRQ